MNNSAQAKFNQQIQWRQFCIAVLSNQTADIKALDIHSSESIDNFIQFLNKHGLQTLLIELLEQQENTNLIANVVKERLVEIRRIGHIKEIYRKQHLQKLLTLLHQANIKCLILKGTALAYRVYQQPYLRPRLDTDILIRIDDKKKIEHLLMDNNFTKSTTISGELISYQHTYTQTQRDMVHAYDIHWKISNRNAYVNLFNFDQLYDNKIDLTVLSNPAYGLDDVSAFLHSVVHYFGHRSNERDRLIWIYDLHLLCSQFSAHDWALLVSEAGDKQFGPLVKRMLEICNDTLRTEFPTAIINQLEKTQVELSELENKRLNAEQWSRIDQFKSDWAVLNFKQRCQLIKEYLLPPSEFILAQNNSDNKFLLPYFYLKRVIIGGFRILLRR